MYCVAKHCRSNWRPKSHIKFHSFPKDEKRRQLWLSIVPVKGKISEFSKICSLHFKRDDYDPEKPERLLSSASPYYMQQPCDCTDTKACTSVPSVQTISHQENLKTRKRDYGQSSKENVPPDSSKSSTKIEHTDILPSSANTAKTVEVAEVCTGHYSKEPVPADSSKSSTKIEHTDIQPSSANTAKTVEVAEVCTGHYSKEPVTGDDEPPVKRRCLRDFNMQVKIKSAREIQLEKSKKVLHQKVTRQKRKIEDLSSVVDIVRQYTSQSEIENILNGNYANICNALNKTPAKTKVQPKYSEEVKSFALTLHFYSPRAYEYLRSIFSLPHKTTLWRSISSFNCDVGFLTEVMEYLKKQIPEKPHLANVALIFDSMSLKADVKIADKLGKLFGYVDLGNIPVSDTEQLATEALVFQIVSYTTYFKCPIGYFFTPASLPGELLGQLTYSALVHLNDIGITVRSITCDGAKCNIKALQNLGCSLSVNNLQPYFLHPNGVTNVYCILDAAHMLKLARNTFAECIMTSTDGDILFKYVKLLNDIQEKEGLKLSNKLSKGHVNYQKKMNVRLAAQTLSSSVADAIDFLRQSGDENFRDSEATTKFIRIIDRLFDLMNSRTPFGKHYKSPLSHQNKEVWQSFFNESTEYVRDLKISGTPVTQHIRKTFAIGFLMNMMSLNMLFEDLTTLTENPLKYLLTFKLSQDNLEIFFSLVRARGGTQDNPSPLEFRFILRKLLFRNSVQPSVNANCVDNSFETNHVIEFRNNARSLIENPARDNEDDDDFINDLMKQLEGQQHSVFQKNIIYYIAGFIVSKITKKNSCQFCHDMLTTTLTDAEHDYAIDINKQSAFTAFVNRGKLCFPSEAVYKICLCCDQLFKQAVTMGQLKTKNLKPKLIMAVMQKFYPNINNLFVPSHPITDSLICTDLHESEILKSISNKFFQIRINSYLKNQTQKLLGEIRAKRQKLHKTILFSHV